MSCGVGRAGAAWLAGVVRGGVHENTVCSGLAAIHAGTAHKKVAVHVGTVTIAAAAARAPVSSG